MVISILERCRRFILENRGILPILVLGLVARILLSHSFTYTQDFYTFQFWSLDLVQHGFSSFYTVAKSDYLPGYLFVLMFLGKVFYWFLNHGILLDIQLVYKFPSIISDSGNAILIYLLAKMILPKKTAWLTCLISILNVALLANSTWWGQADSFISFFLLLSLYLLLMKKYELSMVVLGFAQVVKPIAILAVPIYLLWLNHERISVSRLAKLGFIFAATIVLTFVPFYKSGNFLVFIWERYKVTSGFYPYVSLNAFNFWGFLSIFQPLPWSRIYDQTNFGLLSLQNWGYLLFGIGYGSLLVKFPKKIAIGNEKSAKSTLLLINCLTYFLFFMFFTRMHERHLYYSLIFLSILVLSFKKLWQKVLVFLPFLLYLLNLNFSYQQAGNNFLQLPAVIYLFGPILLIIPLVYLFIKFFNTTRS